MMLIFCKKDEHLFHVIGPGLYHLLQSLKKFFHRFRPDMYACPHADNHK